MCTVVFLLSDNGVVYGVGGLLLRLSTLRYFCLMFLRELVTIVLDEA